MNVVRRMKGGKLWNEGVQDAELATLVEQDLDDHEIARRMGFSPATVRRQRIRLGFLMVPKPVYAAPQPDPAPPKEVPNPIAVARAWLGARMTETPDGYRLDGIPRESGYIVREANRLRKSKGLPQVGPEHWRV